MHRFINKLPFLFLGIGLIGAALFMGFRGGRVTSFTASLSNQTSEKPTNLPSAKTLQTDYHIFQTFNNCAPAGLSIALSFYGIKASQEELAEALRPYNNLSGKNDDKSTPPEELAEIAKEYGLIPYFRPNGTIETLKQFIASGMPVIVRTFLHPNEDFAHYRVVKGYDDATKEIVQDDSLEGKDLRFSYDGFLKLWQPFNYGYLVLVPKEKQKTAEKILGKELNTEIAWQHAIDRARREIDADRGISYPRYNLVTALYYAHDYAGAKNVFEAMESQITPHTLWYQIEPIGAYFELGNYDRVFELTDKIFADGNVAASELYLLRGKSYLAKGDTASAKTEFEKAVLYNKNYKPAKEALLSLANN